MNGSEDSKKTRNCHRDQGDCPNLLGRNIDSMRLEGMAPNIKKGAKTKQDKSSKPNPTGDVVKGYPTDMMIPRGNKTFRRTLPRIF